MACNVLVQVLTYVHLIVFILSFMCSSCKLFGICIACQGRLAGELYFSYRKLGKEQLSFDANHLLS